MPSEAYADLQLAIISDVDFSPDLMAKITEIDEAEEDGTTLIYWAARYGHQRFTTALIAAGANKDKPDANGLSPIHRAAMHNHANVIHELILAGVNVNRLSGRGASALFLASTHGGIETVRVLIAAGARITEINRRGDTPLHTAALHDHADIAKTLIMIGASIFSKNPEGDTPLNFATPVLGNQMRQWHAEYEAQKTAQKKRLYDITSMFILERMLALNTGNPCTNNIERLPFELIFMILNYNRDFDLLTEKEKRETYAAAETACDRKCRQILYSFDSQQASTPQDSNGAGAAGPGPDLPIPPPRAGGHGTHLGN